MATLSPEQAAKLKQTYATAEDLQASDSFKKMTSPAQKIALSAYSTAPTITPKPEELEATKNTAPAGGRNVGGRIYDANGTYIGMANATTPVTTSSPAVDMSKVNKTNAKALLNAGKITQSQYDSVQQGNVQQTYTTSPTAPTDTNTPSETTPKTTTPGTGEPSYTDNSTARMSEIQQKLTGYVQTNPEMFRNSNIYKSFFHYNERTPEQKKVLDDFYTNQQQVFKQQEQATVRYNELNSMSYQDLMDITDANDLTLINQDPNLKAKYDFALRNKQMLEFVFGRDYGKTPEPKTDGLADDVKAEIVTAKVDYEGVKTKMDELQEQIDNTYDDLVKQAEGTGETDGYLRAKANKINASLKKEYNDLGRQANTALNKYNALLTESQIYLEEQKAKKQDWDFKLGLFESMYGTYKDRQSTTSGLDPNITKTIERKNAKGQTIGYLQWNPETNRYDIPVEGSMGGTSWGGTGGGGTASSIQPGTQGMSKFYNPSLISTYTAFIEKQTKPTEKQIKALGGFETFAQDAYNAYIKNESSRLGSNNISITDPSRYATKDATEKKQVQTDIRTISQTISKLDNLMKKINEGGMPSSAGVILNTGKQREYNQLLKDVQLALKNEGIYNLGVLNGPDLTVIEGALPNIDISRLAEGKTQYLKYLNNMRDVYISQINEQIASQGLKFTPPQQNLGGTSAKNDISTRESKRGIKQSTTSTTTAPSKPKPSMSGIGLSQFGIGGF